MIKPWELAAFQSNYGGLADPRVRSERILTKTTVSYTRGSGKSRSVWEPFVSFVQIQRLINSSLRNRHRQPTGRFISGDNTSLGG